MKKKYWIILIVLATAIVAAFVVFLLSRPKVYHPESIDPRILHASPANKEIIVGLWHIDNHVFYRFNNDGTGHTWDTDDDLTEEEASPFGWEVYDEAIMITHKMRFRGIVPRYYELDRLNAFDLRFHDNYSRYVLERVEQQMAMEEEQQETD